MLDPYLYRANETQVKTDPEMARLAEVHSVDGHFGPINFPIRINSIQEIGQLLSSMQENRADGFMAEMGGITETEHTLLLRVCRDIVRFQQLFLPMSKPIVPVSVLMSVLCLYKKLLGINENFSSVLEIGPGCGYLSFFLRHHASLSSYCQIEACESYYILQNLVNLHCFGTAFREHAFDPDTINVDRQRWAPPGQSETLPDIQPPTVPMKCEHFPWWHLKKLGSRKFQIVTSNANLLEFSPAALDEYLRLIVGVLDYNGVLIAQCCGQHLHGTAVTLIEKTEKFGLTNVAMLTLSSTMQNGLWIKKDATLVDRVFNIRPPDRTVYSMREIVAETEDSLDVAPTISF